MYLLSHLFSGMCHSATERRRLTISVVVFFEVDLFKNKTYAPQVRRPVSFTGTSQTKFEHGAATGKRLEQTSRQIHPGTEWRVRKRINGFRQMKFTQGKGFQPEETVLTCLFQKSPGILRRGHWDSGAAEANGGSSQMEQCRVKFVSQRLGEVVQCEESGVCFWGQIQLCYPCVSLVWGYRSLLMFHMWQT